MTPSSLVNYIHLILRFYVLDTALQKWRTRRLGPLGVVGGPATGSVALVTGGTSGIGKATALELGRRGATVILPCRDLTRGEEVAEEIRAAQTSANQKADVRVLHLDLSNLSSVDACVKDVQNQNLPLHILVNNGGIYDLGGSRKQTNQGYELHMATNHLSHFSLTLQLLPLMKKTAAACPGGVRIVNVSSHLHFLSDLRANNMHLVKSFDSQTAYANSKCAQVLFTRLLRRHLGDTGVHAFAVHPGIVRTSITRSLPIILQNGQDLIRYFHFTPEEGARSVLFCSTAENAPAEALKSDGYLSSDCTPFTPGTQARSETLASFVWRFSVHAADIPGNLDIVQV